MREHLHVPVGREVHGNTRLLQDLASAFHSRFTHPAGDERFLCFFFNVPAPTEIYTSVNTLSLHDALPICRELSAVNAVSISPSSIRYPRLLRSEEHTSELQSLTDISYAVFCLKKKKK